MIADCSPANLLQWNPSETIRIFDPRPQCWSLNARHFGHRHCRWCSLLQYFCYAMFGPNYDFSFTDLKWYNVWKDMRLMDEESFWIFRDHIFTWWCFIRVPRETIYLHSCHQSHCYTILQIPWILLASKWLVLYSVATLPVAFSLNLTLTVGPYWSSSSYIYYGKSYSFITQVHSRKGWSENAKSAICTNNVMLERSIRYRHYFIDKTLRPTV